MATQTPDNVLEHYKKLEGSPMFKLSLSSRELFHSNFLEWLSNVDKDSFRRLINTMSGLGEDDPWPAVWRVKREFKNFDLCVVAYDKYSEDTDEKIEDDPDFRLLFVLENKVKSIPYQEQLQEYTEKATGLNKAYWGRAAKAYIQGILKDKIKPNESPELRLHKDEQSGRWTVQRKNKQQNKRVTWDPIIDPSIDLTCPPCEDAFPFVEESSIIQGVSGINSFSRDFTEKMRSGNEVHYILLSLAKDFPNYPSGNSQTEWELGGVKWKIIYYKGYKDLIRHFYHVSENLNLKEKNLSLTKAVIDDYCGFIDSLCHITEEWSNEYKDYGTKDSKFLYYKTVNKKRDYYDNYKEARRLRIHDLYQKLKFSYLCAKLYQEIKSQYEVDGWTVFPSNQGGLFKDSNFEIQGKLPDKYICVNYTYLHGEPLLEINVRPEKKAFYYAIQVQGSAYEHGIQVMADRENDRVKPIYADYVWKQLENSSLEIKHGWMTIEGSPIKWDKEEKAIQDNQNSGKDYKKYDMSNGAGTFVYQSREIKENATIMQVLDLMKRDLDYITQP